MSLSLYVVDILMIYNGAEMNDNMHIQYCEFKDAFQAALQTPIQS